MPTATALRHIETALRSRLGIGMLHARRIVDRRPLNSGLDGLIRDVRGCVAIVGDLGGGCRGVSLHSPDADGVLRRFGELDLLPEDLVRFDAMPIEQAHAIPEGMFLPDPEDGVPATGIDEVYEWRDGSILSREIVDGHVRVVAEIGGVRSVHAMIPLFGTAADLAAYVDGTIGLKGRLCVTAAGPHRDGIGIPSDMPVIDMIVPDRDIPRIAAAFHPGMAA